MHKTVRRMGPVETTEEITYLLIVLCMGRTASKIGTTQRLAVVRKVDHFFTSRFDGTNNNSDKWKLQLLTSHVH